MPLWSVEVLDAWIVAFLFFFAALADAFEEVLLVQNELACRDVFNACVCIADCKLFTLLDVSNWHEELCSSSEDCNAVGATAVIEQVGWCVDSGTCSEERLV